MNSQNIDLSRMDLDALKELRKKLDRTITNYETQRRQAALSAVEQMAKEHGFKLGDLLGEGMSRKGRKAARIGTADPAKYVNPEDPEQTWSGRGRRPRWVNKALEEGRLLEELAA